MGEVGSHIGRFRIDGILGRGGMGEVYAGWDDKLQRRVALKAIRGERRLEPEAKARFLREARILSQLDHPGICRIYELVEEDDGDFLVLELISGQSLRRALHDGLVPAYELYIAEKVAEALAAAHAKGVVHRDLKPDNVMLTDDGLVKVLDFGLAHTVDGRLGVPGAGDASAETRSEDAELPECEPTVLASTPIPSPGAEPSTLPIAAAGETAATVLRPAAADEPTPAPAAGGGVTLFETEHGAVMGTVAYMSPEQARGERATAASDVYSFGLVLQEMLTGRAPYEPGTPIFELLRRAATGETLPVTGVDPDLAALIERAKAVVPEARPSFPEILERLWWIRGKRRRLWRRLAAAAIVLVLVAGGVKYTLDLRRERARAVEARREAEQVSELLLTVFATSDPRAARGHDVTARELLDAGAARIVDGLRGQPALQGRMMLTIGRVYRQLGYYDQARPLLTRALELRRSQGPDDLETVAHLDQLASLHHDLGEHAAAAARFERALALREEALGPDHPHVAESLNNLAFAYAARGDTARAEPLLLRALAIQERALGAEHPNVAASLANLGDLYRARGELARAEPFLRRAVEVQETRLGADHPDLAASLNNLAMVYQDQGAAGQAEPLYRRTLAISETVFGAEHPNVATILNNLAELYRATGRPDEAEPLYRRALAIQEPALGAEHPAVAVTVANLADLLRTRGDLDGAEPLYRRALAIQERALGPEHPSVAVTAADFAALRLRQGRLDDAEALYRRALDIAETRLAAQPSSRAARARLAAVEVGLGRLSRATGDEERAAAWWRRAAERMAPLTAGSDVARQLHTHALALLHLGRVDEARPLVERLRAVGWSHPDFLAVCREHGLADAA